MLENFIFGILLLILLFLSVIDIKQKTVPFTGQILILLLGIIQVIFGEYSGTFYIKGGVILFLISFSVAFAGHGLGGGDVKLFGGIGMIFGAYQGLLVMAGAFVLSAIFVVVYKLFNIKKRIKEIPFVPFIALSVCLIFLENPLYCV